MTSNGQQPQRDSRTLAAWAILALQIAGLVLLLLFGQDTIAALRGGQPQPATLATAVVEATDAPQAAAAEPTAEPATEVAATTVPALPSAEDAGVLAPEDVAVDAGALAPADDGAPAWLAQVVEGVVPDASAGQPGVPPHLLLSPPDATGPGLALTTPNGLDLTRPQMRVVPIAALLAWLQARNDTAGQDALEDLQSLLEEQPAPDEASVPPSPLLGGSSQMMVARVTYEGFRGGQGVAYIGRVATGDDAPPTNESGLNYFFQGVTADGKHYVFMSWPVAAAFLPDGPADVPADTLASMAADSQAYYDGMRAQLEAAAADDLQPAPEAMDDMIASLAIGAGAAEAAAQDSAPGSPADAAGFVWNWTGRTGGDGDESAVANPQDYNLVFWPDGTFSVKADCNVGRGTWTANDDGTVSLVPGPMTMAACAPDSRDGEFLQALAAARSLAFNESGDMVMTLTDGSSAVFANVGPAEAEAMPSAEAQPDAAEAGLTGVTLQWPGFTGADGNTVTVENPENYSLVFLPDGTFNFRADCNMGAGVYEYDDGALTLATGAMTLAACPEGSQSDTFVSFLNDVTSAEPGPDGNPILTTASGSSATFVNTGPVETPGAPAGGELVGTVWQWTEFQDTAGLNDLTVPNPEDYLLTFMPDGSFAVKADCNVGQGDYTVDGAALALAVGPMTRAACGPDSLGDRYVQFLNATATHVFDQDGQLVLNLKFDSGNLVFADGGPAEMPAAEEPEAQPAADEAGVAGVTLQWPGFTDADGNTVAAENPEDYFLVLLPDGTFTFKADCNVGTGVYEYGPDGALTLTPGAMTLAACPEGSQADAFLAFLSDVNGATVDADGNPTLTTNAGDSATFVNLGPVEAPPGEAAAEGDLLDVVWQWTALGGPATDIQVDDPERYYLVFLDDGTYLFVADCNRGSGTYTRDGSTLALAPGPMTLVACDEGSQSDQFVALFNQVEGYTLDGGNLLLTLPDGNVATLANAGPFSGMDTGGGATGDDAAGATDSGTGAPLSGAVWQWATFRDAKQDYAVPDTTDYTIVFNNDGTVNVVADCNNASGAYTINSDGTMTLSVRAMTRAACPEGSLSNSFIEYLNMAGPFEVDEAGVLTIELLADGGTMTFVQAP